MKIRATLALVLALAGLVLVGPVSPAQASGIASAIEAYPPTICPTISVSTTKPAVGETITVTGQNFDPSKSVTLVLNSKTYVLATVKTDAAGSFSTKVKMPAGLTGSHVLSVKGAQSGCPADPIQIVIGGAPVTSPATGPNGGPPAFTGVDVLWLLLAAAALIGVGVLLNRRRGADARHTHSRV
jgi:IPT/TIG domain-containing protein